MRIFNLRKYYVLPILLLSMLANNSYAQDTFVEKGEMKFVCTWPNIEMMDTKKSFFKYLNDVVFASNDFKITKPVALLKDSISNYWILDQESKTILEGNNKEYKFPKFIEREKKDLASLAFIANYSEGKMLVCDSYLNKIFVVDPANKAFYSFNDSLNLLRPTGIVYSQASNLIWVQI